MEGIYTALQPVLGLPRYKEVNPGDALETLDAALTARLLQVKDLIGRGAPMDRVVHVLDAPRPDTRHFLDPARGRSLVRIRTPVSAVAVRTTGREEVAAAQARFRAAVAAIRRAAGRAGLETDAAVAAALGALVPDDALVRGPVRTARVQDGELRTALRQGTTRPTACAAATSADACALASDRCAWTGGLQGEAALPLARGDDELVAVGAGPPGDIGAYLERAGMQDQCVARHLLPYRRAGVRVLLDQPLAGPFKPNTGFGRVFHTIVDQASRLLQEPYVWPSTRAVLTARLRHLLATWDAAADRFPADWDQDLRFRRVSEDPQYYELRAVLYAALCGVVQAAITLLHRPFTDDQVMDMLRYEDQVLRAGVDGTEGCVLAPVRRALAPVHYAAAPGLRPALHFVAVPRAMAEDMGMRHVVDLHPEGSLRRVATLADASGACFVLTGLVAETISRTTAYDEVLERYAAEMGVFGLRPLGPYLQPRGTAMGPTQLILARASLTFHSTTWRFLESVLIRALIQSGNSRIRSAAAERGALCLPTALFHLLINVPHHPGSRSVAERLARGPFHAPAPPLSWDLIRAVEARSLAVPGCPSLLGLWERTEDRTAPGPDVLDQCVPVHYRRLDARPRALACVLAVLLPEALRRSGVEGVLRVVDHLRPALGPRWFRPYALRTALVRDADAVPGTGRYHYVLWREGAQLRNTRGLPRAPGIDALRPGRGDELDDDLGAVVLEPDDLEARGLRHASEIITFERVLLPLLQIAQAETGRAALIPATRSLSDRPRCALVGDAGPPRRMDIRVGVLSLARRVGNRARDRDLVDEAVVGLWDELVTDLAAAPDAAVAAFLAHLLQEPVLASDLGAGASVMLRRRGLVLDAIQREFPADSGGVPGPLRADPRRFSRKLGARLGAPGPLPLVTDVPGTVCKLERRDVPISGGFNPRYLMLGAAVGSAALLAPAAAQRTAGMGRTGTMTMPTMPATGARTLGQSFSNTFSWFSGKGNTLHSLVQGDFVLDGITSITAAVRGVFGPSGFARHLHHVKYSILEPIWGRNPAPTRCLYDFQTYFGVELSTGQVALFLSFVVGWLVSKGRSQYDILRRDDMVEFKQDFDRAWEEQQQQQQQQATEPPVSDAPEFAAGNSTHVPENAVEMLEGRLQALSPEVQDNLNTILG
ncbi:MAG: hypothetical protein AAFS07_18810, partial [Pseudomonadota bacterium]